ARYKFRKVGDLTNDDNVYKLVDYIYSGDFAKDTKNRTISFQWRWMIKRIEPDYLAEKILASDRSERALFAIMMEVFAERRGKSVHGEKTPAHLRYVDTIIEWFPQAKIVHMLRDPRGIYVSEYRRRKELPVTPPFKQLNRFDFLFKLYIVLQVTAIWIEGLIRSAKYSKRYPQNYYLQRFEDVVSKPDVALRDLCRFLNVGFDDKMLDQIVVSRGFQAGQKGFDREAATRWKKHIDPWVERWFKLIFGRQFKKFGYPLAADEVILTGKDKTTVP
ncbi:MAG: sulfotransferase, partial [Anaerolineae bacterium]|nr:sulfotransferase [Anaerolineae bacterium]